MATKEQNMCENLVVALTELADSLQQSIPDDAERSRLLRSLHDIRHHAIHLGYAIRDMRAPIGLDSLQKESVSFLLDLAQDVSGDTLEDLRISSARAVLKPLLNTTN